MSVRRVVTGRAESGSSIVVSDGPAPRTHAYEHVPGLVEALVWATDDDLPAPSTAADGVADPSTAARSFVPGTTGTRCILLEFPPDTVFADPSFDPAAARAEQVVVSPGLGELFEADAPGMHTTPTVDYAIVVKGDLWLELDDGHETHLAAGDVVVQNGTRHAWRNHGSRPAMLAVILVGAAAATP